MSQSGNLFGDEAVCRTAPLFVEQQKLRRVGWLHWGQEVQKYHFWSCQNIMKTSGEGLIDVHLTLSVHVEGAVKLLCTPPLYRLKCFLHTKKSLKFITIFLFFGFFDKFKFTHDVWHLTYDIWHVTCDTWHTTCDMSKEVNLLSKFQWSGTALH